MFDPDDDIREGLAAFYSKSSRRPPPRPATTRPIVDAIASNLLHCCDGRSDDWADIIDMLTLHKEERRKMQLIREIEIAERR